MTSRGVTLTRHARQRMKQRVGVTGAAAERIASRARRRGTPASEIQGNARWRILGVLNNVRGKDAIVYGEHVYVFSGPRLVTVLHLRRGPMRG